jgi:hypothetical protein
MSIGKKRFSFMEGVLMRKSVMIQGMDISMGNWMHLVISR